MDYASQDASKPVKTLAHKLPRFIPFFRYIRLVKVAFFIFGSEPRHWNTGLEVALREFAELKELEIIWVAGGTPYIPFYSINGLSRRKLLHKPPKYLTKIVSKIKDNFPSLLVKVQFLNVNSNSELQRKVQDFLHNDSKLDSLDQLYPMMGAAVTNALISETRDKSASVDTHKKLVLLLCKSYASTFESLSQFISNSNYNHVILFNGRFIHEKALWAVTETFGIDKTIFECTRDRYILFEFGPHERFSVQTRMKEIWNTALRDNRNVAIEIASEYFESLNQSQVNRFVPKKIERLEESFDFSFFTNSDDEAIGLGNDWISPLGDNFQITNEVIKIFETGELGTLAIRIHPNLKNKAIKEQLIWRQLRGNKFVRIFEAQSQISAFQLVSNSKFVITTGSTVGAEAVYRLKPVAILAPARYDQLDCTSNISSIQELQKWCKNVSKFGISKEALLDNRVKILALGYWMAASGTKHKLLEARLGPDGGFASKSFLGVTNHYSMFSKITDRLTWYMYFLEIRLCLRIWKR